SDSLPAPSAPSVPNRCTLQKLLSAPAAAKSRPSRCSNTLRLRESEIAFATPSSTLPHPFDRERRQEVEAVLAPAVVPCAAKIRFRPQLPLLPPTMTKIHADPASLASCLPSCTLCSVLRVLCVSSFHRISSLFAFRADSTRFPLDPTTFLFSIPT